MKKVVFGVLAIIVLGLLVMFYGRWELHVYTQTHTGENGLSLGQAGSYWSKEACQVAGAEITKNGYRGYPAKFTCGIGCRRVGLDGHTCFTEE